MDISEIKYAKILITDGAGFIGSHFSKELAQWWLYFIRGRGQSIILF